MLSVGHRLSYRNQRMRPQKPSNGSFQSLVIVSFASVDSSSASPLGTYRDRESRYRLVSHFGQSHMSDSLAPGQTRSRSVPVLVRPDLGRSSPRSRSATIAFLIETVCVILINLVIPSIIVWSTSPVEITSFNTRLFSARKRSSESYRRAIFSFANLFNDDETRTLLFAWHFW